MKRLLTAATALLASGSLAAGTFSPAETWSTVPFSSWQRLVGDFDGDGRLDLTPQGVGPDSTSLAFRRLLINTGAGFTAPRTWSGSNVCSGTCFTGDFNGDELTDLLDLSGLKVSLSLNGSFSPATAWGGSTGAVRYPPAAPTTWFTGRFASTDRDDFASLTSQRGQPIADWFWVNASTGSNFESAMGAGVVREARTDLAPQGSMLSATGDVTGDGLSDIVLVSAATGDAYVHRNLGVLFGYAPAKRWVTGLPAGRAISVARMNKDAAADLIVETATGEVAIAYAGGHNFQPPTSHALGCTPTRQCVFGDFTGDGWGDVLSSAGSGFQVQRWVETPSSSPPRIGPIGPAPLPPLPWLHVPIIGVYSNLVQSGVACGSTAVVFVDPQPTTARVRVEAIDTKGIRRLVQEWLAPKGGQLDEPLWIHDTALTRATVTYLATATHANGIVNTITTPFNMVPDYPLMYVTAALASSTQVRITVDITPVRRFTTDESIRTLDLSLAPGHLTSCTRSGSQFSCLVPRDRYNEQQDANFPHSELSFTSSELCAGQPQFLWRSDLIPLFSLPAFPVSSGTGGGGGGDPRPPPPSRPNLVLSIPRHDGFNANYAICNMGTAGVPTSASDVGFTYQSVGWTAAMRLDVTAAVRGLMPGACTFTDSVGISVSSGAGGGAADPASSVHFCVDDRARVDEGTAAAEIDNCIDVGRR